MLSISENVELSVWPYSNQPLWYFARLNRAHDDERMNFSSRSSAAASVFEVTSWGISGKRGYLASQISPKEKKLAHESSSVFVYFRGTGGALISENSATQPQTFSKAISQTWFFAEGNEGTHNGKQYDGTRITVVAAEFKELQKWTALRLSCPRNMVGISREACFLNSLALNYVNLRSIINTQRSLQDFKTGFSPVNSGIENGSAQSITRRECFSSIIQFSAT